MKKLLVAISIMLMGAQASFAADMAVKAARPAPPVPVVNWTGCYIGGGVGYGLFNSEHYGIGTTGQQTFLPMRTGGEGWLGTVGAGCDYQFAGPLGNWVVGAFGDYDWMDIKGKHGWSCIFANGCNFNGGGSPTTGAADDLRERSAWYVGARIGLLVAPNVLSYVSGGYTQTSFDDVRILSPGPALPGADTGARLLAHTHKGWFLGGGTEIMMTQWLPGLSWKTEYRYARYDSVNAAEVCQFVGNPAAAAQCGAVGPTGVVDHQTPNVQTIRTTLNYKFNWGGPMVAKY